MRVLALETEASGTRGGQEHSLFDVCVGLAGRGHAVTLAYVEDGDLIPRYQAAGVRTVRVRGYSIDRAHPLRSAAAVAVSLVRALGARPDIVYINQYHDTLFASAVARLLHVPLVCHLRLFPPSEFCGQWRIGLSGVSRFIAVSKATRDAYIERGFDPRSIDLVLNGIDVDRFRPLDTRASTRESLGLAPDTYTALYIGRIDRGKDIEGLLRAFAAMRPTVADARLLIAGRPLNHGGPAGAAAYLESLQELARSLGVAGDVRWLGPRSDAVELYNAADVCVLPSRHGETFGRVVAEAMACEIPAIGTALGGIPEVMVGEASRLIVPPEDVASLAARMRELVDWRTRDPTLGKRLRQIVLEHFDARRMADAVANVLERTVAEGTIRRGPRFAGARGEAGAVVAR